jgi:hypothetical protein
MSAVNLLNKIIHNSNQPVTKIEQCEQFFTAVGFGTFWHWPVALRWFAMLRNGIVPGSDVPRFLTRKHLLWYTLGPISSLQHYFDHLGSPVAPGWTTWTPISD